MKVAYLSIALILLGMGGLYLNIAHSGWVLGVGLFVFLFGSDNDARFLSKAKDGGPDSTVTGYWLIEIKWLFSIVLLKFEGKSRPVYHDHAFNAISWVLSGWLEEHVLYGGVNRYFPSIFHIFTSREDMHMVHSADPTWVLSFRGPWAKEWNEYNPLAPEGERVKKLTDGRKEVVP